MTTYRQFETAMADGADCEQLIALRNRLPIQDKEAAAVQLRRKGCVGPSPEQACHYDSYFVEDYRVVYYVSADHTQRRSTAARPQDSEEAPR